MEQGPTEKAIIERSIRYRTPLPETIQNAPSLHMGLEFYFNAFQHLSTCRVSGMGIGQISYFMCVEYCEKNDIYGDQRDDLIDIVLELDTFYVDYITKKSEKKSKKKLNRKNEPETEPDEVE